MGQRHDARHGMHTWRGARVLLEVHGRDQLHGIGLLREHGEQPDLHGERHVGHLRRAPRVLGELLM